MARICFSTSSDLIRTVCENLGLENQREAVSEAYPGGYVGRTLTNVEFDSLQRQIWSDVTSTEWPFGQTDADAIAADAE